LCHPIGIRTSFAPDLRHLESARRFVRAAIMNEASPQTAEVMMLLEHSIP
jgi:hypothetical protein